ncbi:hypothetical protein HOY82DRAFT_638865 [Tuber indicum]|nr:hypothetical protein HOY82DRAFT_638865 [Tuber indicum]
MPPLDHSLWHDTFIYSSDNRDEKLGGLWAGSTFTNDNLYSMVEILCFFTDTFDIHDEGGQLVGRDGGQLRAGNYFIVTCGSITVDTDVPLIRLPTVQSGPRVDSFRTSVQAQDRGCAITGIQAELAHLGNWRGFHTCHICPLVYEQQWNEFGYGSWITVPPAKEWHGSINSVQNGILLLSHIHTFFDTYEIAINPNDNYKFVCVSPDMRHHNIAGRSLDQTFLDNPLRPPDQLLNWHFRQAVLINMKWL